MCAFSEIKIFPGKGSRFVSRTGQQVILSGSKATAMFMQKKKPALLRWTQAWRRQHKKINVEGGAKRKVRRVVKVQRAYVGASLEEVRPDPAAGGGAVCGGGASGGVAAGHGAVAAAGAAALCWRRHRLLIGCKGAALGDDVAAVRSWRWCWACAALAAAGAATQLACATPAPVPL